MGDRPKLFSVAFMGTPPPNKACCLCGEFADDPPVGALYVMLCDGFLCHADCAKEQGAPEMLLKLCRQPPQPTGYLEWLDDFDIAPDGELVAGERLQKVVDEATRQGAELLERSKLEWDQKVKIKRRTARAKSATGAATNMTVHNPGAGETK